MEFADTMSGLDLPKVLMLLKEKNLNGTLKLSSENVISTIWFKNGEVIYARDSNSLGLLESLQILSLISEEKLMEIKKRATSLDEALLENLLIEEDIIKPQIIIYIRAFQIAETLFTILENTKVSYEFEGGELKNLVRIDLLPKGFNWIEELLKYSHDWVKLRKRLGRSKQIFKQCPLKLSSVKLSKDEQKIYNLVDGKKQLREVVLWSGYSYVATHKILNSLFQNGVIDIVEKPQFRQSVFSSKKVIETLKSIIDLPGIKNAFLVDRTGKKIVCSNENREETDLIPTMALIFATTVEDFEQNLPTSEQEIVGKIEQILVEGNDGSKTLLMVSGKVILVTQAEKDADWGLIRLASKRGLTAIRQLIFSS